MAHPKCCRDDVILRGGQTEEGVMRPRSNPGQTYMKMCQNRGNARRKTATPKVATWLIALSGGEAVLSRKLGCEGVSMQKVSEDQS